MAAIEERISSKGDKSYRAKVRIKGHPIQTATFNTKTAAKAWARNTESAIHERPNNAVRILKGQNW